MNVPTAVKARRRRPPRILKLIVRAVAGIIIGMLLFVAMLAGCMSLMRQAIHSQPIEVAPATSNQ